MWSKMFRGDWKTGIQNVSRTSWAVDRLFVLFPVSHQTSHVWQLAWNPPCVLLDSCVYHANFNYFFPRNRLRNLTKQLTALTGLRDMVDSVPRKMHLIVVTCYMSPAFSRQAVPINSYRHPCIFFLNCPDFLPKKHGGGLTWNFLLRLIDHLLRVLEQNLKSE